MRAQSTAALAAGLLASLVLPAAPARAADHAEAAVLRLGAADGDLSGLYAFTSYDKKHLDLVLPWAPDAGPSTRFSDAVQWVFRVASRPTVKDADAAEVLIVCTFDAAQKISCWAGDEFATGDASVRGGVVSPSGKLRVFAGLRNDPFFFNRTGFVAAAERVVAAFQGTSRDAARCPSVTAMESEEIVAYIKSGQGGSLPKDDFAKKNVLAIIVEIDLPLVTTGGPIVAVSASTHKKP